MGRNNQWVSNFKLGWRYTWTDYIDDVGGSEYADMNDMLSQGQLEQYRKVEQKYGIPYEAVEAAALDFWAPGDGRVTGPRGSALAKDWYFYGGITISRIIPYERRARKQG